MQNKDRRPKSESSWHVRESLPFRAIQVMVHPHKVYIFRRCIGIPYFRIIK